MKGGIFLSNCAQCIMGIRAEDREIRYWKGKIPCIVITRSKMNWLIEFIEDQWIYDDFYPAGSRVTTPARLLWRHPRNENNTVSPETISH